MITVQRNSEGKYEIGRYGVAIALVASEEIANKIAENMRTWPENRVSNQIVMWGFRFCLHRVGPGGLVVYKAETKYGILTLNTTLEKLNEYFSRPNSSVGKPNCWTPHT